jgi:hypothetical protein
VADEEQVRILGQGAEAWNEWRSGADDLGGVDLGGAQPGDVIIIGTPGGVGAARTPAVYMQPGDVFEVEIEGIGVLSNPVQDE